MHLPPRHPKSLNRLLEHAATTSIAYIPRVLRTKLKATAAPYTIDISVVGPKRMRSLNRKFRKKDKHTDVLAFSQWEGLPTGNWFIGDVIICASVVNKQAKELGVSSEEELQRVLVHGILHLFGYDHQRSAAASKCMFSIQERIVKKLIRESPR